MIILMSPTKTFNKTQMLGKKDPLFKNESLVLLKQLNKYSIDAFMKDFKVSQNIAKTSTEYHKNINYTYAASFLYGGTAFKYLDISSIKEDNLSNLYILSGLYGILNAFDRISPYRLEISSNILGNLYDYWDKPVNGFLEKLSKDNLIINLASNEYSKYLNTQKLNMITINFIEIKNGKHTSQSMMLKKYRGLMANHLLNLNTNDKNDIKQIVIDDFRFNENLSNQFVYTFTKEM